MWHGGVDMGWWMAVPSVVGLLMLGLIAYAVVEALHGDRRREPPASPVDLAALRYARGEIGREDFERIRDALLGGSTR
jgi:uncharacterized membrane protein